MHEWFARLLLADLQIGWRLDGASVSDAKQDGLDDDLVAVGWCATHLFGVGEPEINGRRCPRIFFVGGFDVCLFRVLEVTECPRHREGVEWAEGEGRKAECERKRDRSHTVVPLSVHKECIKLRG